MPSVRISRQLFDPLPGRRDGRRPMRFAAQASGLRAGAPVYIHKIPSGVRPENQPVQQP
jgi:hypothetical protein